MAASRARSDATRAHGAGCSEKARKDRCASTDCNGDGVIDLEEFVEFETAAHRAARFRQGRQGQLQTFLALAGPTTNIPASRLSAAREQVLQR